MIPMWETFTTVSEIANISLEMHEILNGCSFRAASNTKAFFSKRRTWSSNETPPSFIDTLISAELWPLQKNGGKGRENLIMMQRFVPTVAFP